MNVANVVLPAHVSPSRITSCPFFILPMCESNSLFHRVKSGFTNLGTLVGLNIFSSTFTFSFFFSSSSGWLAFNRLANSPQSIFPYRSIRCIHVGQP